MAPAAAPATTNIAAKVDRVNSRRIDNHRTTSLGALQPVVHRALLLLGPTPNCTQKVSF